MVLIALLIFALIACFLAGLIIVITAETKQKRKVGIILLIIPIVIMIIAGAVCGMMLRGLGGGH